MFEPDWTHFLIVACSLLPLVWAVKYLLVKIDDLEAEQRMTGHEIIRMRREIEGLRTTIKDRIVCEK